ncbi:co-chaperone GroES [Candidatus Wolfebacteria bacterium CG03_land_8_20_14_0_80_40_12]|uniref:Co-chaperonin GroES n=1 Tax=Candidatus Wolfebacteria bacterium CG03_land_8_20_14_0_80_40_12 TaxID=1975069 RepID=A0A2M7B598_9BACT|nr:MAG: co-chaperone GroES [Candidatus Wolfebacteria bacterium CG03_land_8_20_14_0_80_40_12]
MNIKPLSNHIFLEPVEEEKTTKSGIVLPETVEKEKPIKGKIIAVGQGKRNEKGERISMSVKVGDIVLFKKYGLDEIEIESASGRKKYLVGDEDDILAILE